MSEVLNPFKPDVSTYTRKITPVADYVEQGAFYLHTKHPEVPLEECAQWIRESLKNRTFPNVRDPKVSYLKRADNGDRAKEECTLTQYIGNVIREEEILAPTMTTYTNAKKNPSLLAAFIKDNVKKRGIFKKQMFVYKAAKEKLKEFFADCDQRNTKLSNNAVSGAHASASTPLYNQTSHSTLTSNCRMTSGYGNANNEKLLSGNRHYFDPDIVLNNITSIVTHTDYVNLESVMTKYSLVYPDVQQTLECIQYSTDLYWFSPDKMLEIKDYLRLLTPIQRAAFVYTGDLYHVAKFNEAFMHRFIGELSYRPTLKYMGPLTFDPAKNNALKEIGKYNEDYVNCAKQICSELVAGVGKKYDKMMEQGREDDLRILMATVVNVDSTIHKYADFIKATMVTDNVPAAVPYFPTSIRRAALTSDTDSTIFTVQDWVKWKTGKMTFDPGAIAVGATMIFLSSQAIIHILARMSKNAGIAEEDLHTIAMKNEYYFPLFAPTSVSKHYYAIKSCQEGDVFAELEKEIKGVHLKSSNAPKKITKAAQDLMIKIVTDIYEGRKISLLETLKYVADVEREVLRGLKAGEPSYYRLGQVHPAASYKLEKERSPYFQYMLWKEVFAPKYGDFGEPPYVVIKVATTMKSPTLYRAWVASIEDEALRMRLEAFMARNNKATLGSIYVPIDATLGAGIPDEIMQVTNTRRIVGDICTVFYYILETLGYQRLNKNYTHLVSDEY